LYHDARIHEHQGIATLILKPDTRWGWLAVSCCGCFTPAEGTPVIFWKMCQFLKQC